MAAAAPFPWGPIGTLWLINFSTTFANWSVMPFVPYLVFDLGLVADLREPVSSLPLGRAPGPCQYCQRQCLGPGPDLTRPHRATGDVRGTDHRVQPHRRDADQLRLREMERQACAFGSHAAMLPLRVLCFNQAPDALKRWTHSV